MYDCANAGYLKQKPPPVHVLTQLLAIFFIATTALAQSSPASTATGPAEPTLTYTVKTSDKLVRLSAEMLVNPPDG